MGILVGYYVDSLLSLCWNLQAVCMEVEFSRPAKQLQTGSDFFLSQAVLKAIGLKI